MRRQLVSKVLPCSPRFPPRFGTLDLSPDGHAPSAQNAVESMEVAILEGHDYQPLASAFRIAVAVPAASRWPARTPATVTGSVWLG